ncbi:MAG: UTP--glucose-1-phosphate uridylyltransferase GalU [Clostridia bacterium]|nr:UTP--glucose-1-phosphate uridylyltransferase GalU [Clostridia bacterium]MBN2882812.1 UTP--glucose-1-phosphate uridylyltransferase GalU [Clostridia bacterium]
MKVRKAVIPAAGLGTRFLPATKAQPKEMLPIVDKPTIQYIIEEAVSAGIEDIFIISGRGKRAIEDHFDKSFELEDMLKKRGESEVLDMVEGISNMVNIYYVRQKEPGGLGQAIHLAKPFIGNEPFAVMLGDDIVVSDMPCIGQMMKQYEECNGTIIGIQKVPMNEVSSYGVVGGSRISENLYKISEMVEKPTPEEAPSNMAIMGRYIITPEIFECLERTKPGKNNEIQLTDALALLLEKQDIYAYEYTGKRYDVGNKLGFLKATVELALSRDDLKDDFRKYLTDLLKED